MKNIRILTLLVICHLVFLGVATAQPTHPKPPGGSNSSNNSSSFSSVGETLRYINRLFDQYNGYNSKLNVDMLTNELVFTDKFSEIRGKFSDVEFRRSSENMGIFCKSGMDCMLSKNVNTGAFESYRSSYTFGIKENGVAVPEMDGAINQLNQMLNSLSSGNSSNSSSYSVNSEIQRNLDIINNSFKKYNAYNTVFRVNGTRLYWDSDVANVSGDLNNLTFYINYANKWMVVQCVNGDCLEGGISKDDYSMSLKTSSGALAPDIEEVLQAFNNIRREVLK
ncbi:MAG: hypothetical protein R2773_06550 [Flavobacteriaceae bacterium]